MDNVELMLRAVLDNPYDYTARLVYADALSERDDHAMRDSDRAEYIRVANRITNGDYSQKDIEQLKEITENQANAFWYHPFDNQITFCGYRWYRGFIDCIDVTLPFSLHPNTVDTLRQTAKSHPLTKVVILSQRTSSLWICCHRYEDVVRISSSAPWALRRYLNPHYAEYPVRRGDRIFQVFRYKNFIDAKEDMEKSLVAYAHAPRLDPDLVSRESRELEIEEI